ATARFPKHGASAVGPKVPVDVRNELADDVVFVTARGSRVEILRPPVAREAIGHDDDRLAHLPGADEPVETLGQLLDPRSAREQQLAEAGEPAEDVVDRISPLWIRRWQ